VTHLIEAKRRGERWAMLTAYDQYAAQIFDEAGIPALLVGDSAANNVFGHTSTVQLSFAEFLPLVAAVSRSARRALVIADMPFGTYQLDAGQALQTGVTLMREGGAHAVKLEGGRRVARQIETLVEAGIPVMGHLGFTPQSEHAFGGYRVQGRGATAAELVKDAVAVQQAGAFAVVLEMVPAELARQITAELAIPTVGIGAGPHCDAQVLVWQDMAGLRTDRLPRFVKQYADLRSTLRDAACAYADEVRSGIFPAAEHSFD
jgi:3-methyl-2-oxobutanoate hydroxymethyltransferase